MGVNFLGRVPIDPQMVKMGDLGQPYVLDEPEEEGPKAFHAIAEALVERIEEE